MADDLVKVAVRIRPMVTSEIEKGCESCLRVIDGESQIQIQSSEKTFTFNYVFPQNISQQQFYNTAIKHMVSNIFEGYNVTILAYGQTGSGKTFSMGTNYNVNESECGIIPRAVNDIFEQIHKKEDWDFKVTVAFMELYKEQLYDLLSKKPRNQCIVDIREDVKGIKVVGISEIPVANPEETLQCLANGSLCRATGATAMNLQSSRSHAIFTVSVHQQKKNEPNTAKFAKFHLVDLAGSERSKKTQATGERFKEGVNINKGLLALGNVISQLGEGGNLSYIGYRDSKLTRLLQDSLGGNSVTLMIACVSPADYNLDETVSTLRYADRAKKIKNKPIVNQDPRVAEICNLKKTIQELRSAMLGQVNGNFCPPEHMELQEKSASLQKKIRILTEKLQSNLSEIVHMHELAELAEQSREQIKHSLSVILEDCGILLKELDKNPNDTDNHKKNLENIHTKIMTLQSDQKKVNDELVTRELLVESINNISANSESTLNSTEDSNLFNETYDLDEKHEQHTLEQADRVDEVQYINRQLAIKEEIVSNLLKNSSQTLVYQKELQEMEKEIKNLQTEKEELLLALRNAQTNTTSAKLAETRRKKVQELEKKISELTRKCIEQNKTIKNNEKSDLQVKNLTNEIVTLKQTKVKLIRNMRSETDKFNKWKRSREQELFKLKNQDRKRANEIIRLQADHERQKNVFRRKMEEAQAIHKRLKDALDVQKKAAQHRSKTSNSKEDARSWVLQELEVLLSTVEAECTLEKLKEEKNCHVRQLADLQVKNESGSSLSNQLQISQLIEYIELRNKQIENLEQHIKESNQENRAKTRWHVLTTMSDAKDAVKTLFEITVTNGKDSSILKSKLNDAMEKNEKLKAEIEKYQLKELNSKLRKEYSGLSNSNNQSETDKDLLIDDLQKEILSYKDQLESLQNKVLTQKDINIVEKKPKTKSKPKTMSDSFIYEQVFNDSSLIDVDDDENDPDWKQTPLYNRIHKLENTTKNIIKENKIGTKRSSDGEIKCSCKTKCTSRLCSCRKNEKSCENCNCNPNTCQNRDGDSTRRTLFKELRESTEEIIDDEIKKPKLEVSL